MSHQSHQTTEQLIEQSKALKRVLKRSEHRHIGPVDRDPVALLAGTDAGRVERLVPLKYGRMLASPFAFFRGSAVLQAHDLAGTPRTGVQHTICGDAHLMNFGAFATPERQLAFDLNDFDEAHPGPWEWDLKRLVASLKVAARHLGLPAAGGNDAVAAASLAYAQHTRRLAQTDVLSQWREMVTLDALYGSSRTDTERTRLQRAMQKAQRRSHEELLPKLASHSNGRWTLRDAPPALFHIHSEQTLFSHEDDWMRLGHWTELTDHLYKGYLLQLRPDTRALLERFVMQDLAFKVVGVGSVGTRCLVLLLTDGTGAPLMLQIKQANPSVLAAYVPGPAAAIHHQGERVVTGQRLMQANSDSFLGATSGPAGRHFYVRQLRDMKLSAEVETFDANLLTRYGAVCGQVLARAHAKAGGCAPQVSAYLGKGESFADALVRYANAYADQVERDYRVFREACQSGRIVAQTDADMAADFSV